MGQRRNELDACVMPTCRSGPLAEAARPNEQVSAADNYSASVKTGARRISISNLMNTAEALRA
jgi:hypothetical protein